MLWQATFIPNLRMSGAVDGLGTLGQPHGSIARLLNGSWVSACAASVLSIDPCIPRSWPNYSMNFRYHSTVYQISVENPSGVSRGVASIEMDGKLLAISPNIPLTDDGGSHQIRIVLG